MNMHDPELDKEDLETTIAMEPIRKVLYHPIARLTFWYIFYVLFLLFVYQAILFFCATILVNDIATLAMAAARLIFLIVIGFFTSIVGKLMLLTSDEYIRRNPRPCKKCLKK